METTEIKTDQGLVVTLAGRFDANAASEVEETLTKLVDDGEVNLVVDLAEVDYISSIGLRILLKTLKKVTGAEGRLVLCSLTDYVNEVFELSGLVAVFNIASNRQEALDQLR